MRLMAQIKVELDSEDFIEAADHQRRFQEFYEIVRKEYDTAELEFRERRVTAAPGQARRIEIRKPTGSVAQYEDD